MAISGIPYPFLVPALTALAAPLAAFALIMTQLRRRARLAAGVSIAAVSLSFGCAVWLLAANWGMTAPLEHTWQWMVSGNLAVTAGLLLDPLSLLMAVVVATICLLVQIYSLGYMAGDPGFGRYYGFMSLFAWAMLSLTLSANPAAALYLLGAGGAGLLSSDRLLVRKIQRQPGRQKGLCHDPAG